MKNILKYLLVGFVFGIVLTKSEAVSWYRIYEMFQFQSFHMYGIIGVAIFTGVIGIQIIKRNNIKDIKGNAIAIPRRSCLSFCIAINLLHDRWIYRDHDVGSKFNVRCH